ncbi:hypothetical protein CVV67_09130 [Arthrobacter stackebrandtii]|nr:hypothetical protein CVV67_09130 [Arthrobacter stackebrandtii]
MVIAALLAAAVAGPAMWLQRNVVDEAGFTAFAGPLGSNKEFQEAASALLAAEATSALNLPAGLNELAGAVIDDAARGLYTDPGYPAAWTETLRRSHNLTFEAAGNTEVAGDVVLDVEPLVGLIAASVGSNLGITVPLPAELVIRMDEAKVAALLPALTKVGGWGSWLAGAAVVLLALGILVARRRGTALVLSGAGLAVVALVWLLGSGWVQSALGSLVAGPPMAQQIGVELGALARDSWQSGINMTFLAAALLAVLGVLALIVKRGRTT